MRSRARERWPGLGQLRGERRGRRHRPVVDHAVEEAAVLQLLRRPRLAAGHQGMGGGQADQPRQPLGAARAGDQAQRDLGQAHACAGPPHAGVTGQRQLQAAAERHAVDGRDHRLGAGLDPFEHGAQDGLLQLARRAELGDIGAGREGLVAAGKYDAAHGGIGLRGVELLHEARTQRVAQAVDGRLVQRDDGDAVWGIAGCHAQALISCLPISSCWICEVPSYRRSSRTSR
jgi:hypothetical protein